MGRHSASDEDGDAVVSRAPGSPPRPGRHTDDAAAMAPGAVRVKPGPRPQLEPARQPSPRPRADSTAGDLDLIEDAFYGSGHDDDAATAAAQDATVQIPVITAPLLDEAVPDSVTEQIPVVPAVDEQVAGAPAKPSPKPVAAPPVDEAPAAEAAEVPAAEAPDAATPTATASVATDARSDLALLRTRSDVRARVVAAVVVPFVLYVLTLLAVDELSWRILLIWIWAPLITAGVLAGFLLDSAQREPAEPPAVSE